MKVVLIEDDPTLNRALKRVLEKKFDVMSFTDPAVAMEYVQNGNTPDVVVTDIKMPNMSGLEVLAALKRHGPDIDVILITGFGTVDESVQAVKQGAFDYILKPVDPDILSTKLEMIEENRHYRFSCTMQAERQGTMVYRSQVMQDAVNLALRAAPTDSSVLITGQTGTGKGAMARFIHDNSTRSERAFVDINCSNLQEPLFESELFGHRKGAFTGADRDRRGIVKMASGGTLFLDEIGEMPVNLQAKFLRFIETKQYYPLGSETPERSDVRIIAATNRNLEAAIGDGSFREDLYYRLNIISIDLPKLSERSDDIPALAAHFLRHFSHINPGITGFSPEAEACLHAYAYPGNIRELSNIIERAMIIEPGTLISPGSLNLPCSLAVDEDRTLDAVIRRHLVRVLEECGGNKTAAASILGIDPSTIYRKMKEYGIG